MKNIFEKNIYLFTTEDISGYFPVLDLKDKSVLTVGSSGDQAFNALLLGAGEVTLFDINPNTYEFIKLKKDFILKYPRKKAYGEIYKINQIHTSKDIFPYRNIKKMNLYFANDENYEILKEKLRTQEIEVITGDIFNMSKSLKKGEKFDRIIFSNILQYINYYAKMSGYEEKEMLFLRKSFEDWITHLEDNGIIQLLYIYSINGQYQEIINLYDSLVGYNICYHKFQSTTEQDKSLILTYKHGG